MIYTLLKCRICKKKKLSNFFWVKPKGGNIGICGTCKQKYNHEWYRKNKHKHLIDVKRNNLKYYEESLSGRADVKICKRCGHKKTLFSFKQINSDGSIGYRSRCKQCKPKEDAFSQSPYYRKYLQKHIKTKRRTNRSWAIFCDSRNSDKKHARKNNLTVEFIKGLLDKVYCTYCGTKDAKISLDRKNNKLGHLKNNVILACLNCNLTRGNMPYKAWLLVAKALRTANNLGLLTGWLRTKRAAVV